MFGEKNATKAIHAIERAKTLPLSRWLFALAIPEVGRTTATQLAHFHEMIEDVANSQLLRDVLQYHEKRKEKEDAKKLPIGSFKPVSQSHPKAKPKKAAGLPRKSGLSLHKSVLDFFASAAGKKILRTDKSTSEFDPKTRKSLDKKGGGIAVGREDLRAHRNVAVDDARRSDREDRSARGPRYRQRE